jgi:tetratricopeptide (TPR) repeat protein
MLTEAQAAPSQALSLRARALLSLGVLSLQQEYPQASSTLREAVDLLRQTGGKADLSAALAFVGFLGDLNAAEESVALARTTQDKWVLAHCLVWQSHALRIYGGDLQVARRAAAEGIRLSREIGSAWAVARAVFSQGQLAVGLGEWTEARVHLQEGIELFSKSQDRYHANLVRTQLAHVERIQENLTEALELYKQTLLVWHDLGLQAAVARQLECLVMVAAAQGNLQDAVRLCGAAETLREEIVSEPTPQERMEYEEVVERLRNQMELRNFQHLLLEGQGMSTSEAIAFALALPNRRPTVGSDFLNAM